MSSRRLSTSSGSLCARARGWACPCCPRGRWLTGWVAVGGWVFGHCVQELGPGPAAAARQVGGCAAVHAWASGLMLPAFQADCVPGGLAAGAARAFPLLALRPFLLTWPLLLSCALLSPSLRPSSLKLSHAGTTLGVRLAPATAPQSTVTSCPGGATWGPLAWTQKWLSS